MTGLARPLVAGYATPARAARGSGPAPAGPRPAAARPAGSGDLAPGINRTPEGKAGSRRAAISAMAIALLLILGWLLPTERYITPKRGSGYWLGIIGGSMMLLLFLYSARKRVRWLNWLGAVDSWFRFHVILGILGPLCILFHANFSLGATNSNMALFSMLLVTASGLVGRYLYVRVHRGLHGHGTTLDLLRSRAERLRALSVSFLPELVGRLERSEHRLLSAGPHLPVLCLARPAVLWLRATRARRRLHRYVDTALRAAAADSAAVAGQRTRLRQTACAYVDRRLLATRRVAGFQGYERLLSIWHAVHVPLLFILIVAGVVHVVAVHLY